MLSIAENFQIRQDHRQPVFPAAIILSRLVWGYTAMASNSLKRAQVLRLVLQYCQSSSSSSGALQVPGVLPCITATPTCQLHSTVVWYQHHSRCNHTMAQASNSSSSSKTKQPPQEQQQQQQNRGAIGVFWPNQLLDGGR